MSVKPLLPLLRKQEQEWSDSATLALSTGDCGNQNAKEGTHHALYLDSHPSEVKRTAMEGHSPSGRQLPTLERARMFLLFCCCTLPHKWQYFSEENKDDLDVCVCVLVQPVGTSGTGTLAGRNP